MIALLAAFALITVQDGPPSISSVYTDIADCVSVDGPAQFTQRCAGYSGWTLTIGASEHSTGLAYSDRAVAEQFLQRPITDGLYQSFDPRIEWRVTPVDAGWEAFATIHRWRSSTPVIDPETGVATGETRTDSEVLVVTALRPDGPIGACHAAYVDARTVYDANTVARRFADAMADEFRCGVDAPYEIGAGEAVILNERGRL